MEKIPFSRPVLTGNELRYVEECLASGHLAGDGSFTKRVSTWLVQNLNVGKALMTHSATAALEMAALLIDLKPGDEVIMPSFTFVSTANAIVLRGAVPVFVDVRADTMNIDETKIEAAITPRTRAILPVHYAGVASEMDTIMAIAKPHKILVIEDNAQGICARYKGKPLGSLGHMSAISFHETKNIVSGEGGALCLTRPDDFLKAEIIREKGTNRASFFRGEVNKYEWMEVGSSYLPSDILSAVLLAQLESASKLTQDRLKLWNYYHGALADLETKELITRPRVPKECEHNGHIYFSYLRSTVVRDQVLQKLKTRGIFTTFHYVPLHSAPAGIKYGRASGSMKNTDDLSMRLLRLPMWVDVERGARVVDEFSRAVRETQV